MWILYAGLAAFFSALVAILSKLGLEGINSHFATAVRTSFVLVMTWLMVWIVGAGAKDFTRITGRHLLFLLLSAVATGAAWICYNRALQLGPATRVAAVDKLSIVLVAVLSALVFKESMGWPAVAGVALIAGGTVLLVFS